MRIQFELTPYTCIACAIWRIIGNVMSSAKPEVHNVQKIRWFGRAFAEMCSQTDQQTDRQTDRHSHHNTSLPTGDRVVIIGDKG